MENDKVIQKFEAWFTDYGAKAQPMFYFTEHMRNCWHAARAAERAEIVAKLESEEVAADVALKIKYAAQDVVERNAPLSATKQMARAAITKILEVI